MTLEQQPIKVISATCNLEKSLCLKDKVKGGDRSLSKITGFYQDVNISKTNVSRLD